MALTNAERQKLYRKRKKDEALREASRPIRETSVNARQRETPFAKVDEVIELLETLPRVWVGRDGYAEKDRSADFIATFTTPSGRRVLSQIATICDTPSHIGDADKHGTLAFKAGMRRVLNEIQRCFVVREPITTEGTSHAEDAENVG